MKIKTNIIAVSSVAILAFLTACQSSGDRIVPLSSTDDCSAIFENRDPANNKKIVEGGETAANQTITQCKILEVKIDDDTKCEVVGSNKINNLKESLSKNDNDRLILLVPEKKFRETAKKANSFLASNGINVEKYLDSEILNSLKFPYKGIRCEAEDKKFVLWTGNKQVIFTMINN